MTPGGDPSESVLWHDDGSFTLLDDAGMPTSSYNSSGAQLTDSGLGSAMARQFEALFNRGLQAFGDRLVASVAPQQQAAAAPAASSQAKLAQYALLGGLAFLAYKAVAG